MTAIRTYQAPKTVEELVAALSGADDPILIAGGQSLLPALRDRRVRCGAMIDVGGVATLKDIAIDDAGVTIGAAVVMADLMRGRVAARFPALAQAAAHVGNHVVRGRSTLGGCLAWANPRAEMPMMMMALDARIQTQRRSFPASRLMTGAYATILEPDEAILSVHVPNARRMVFDELIPRNSTGRAMVSVACARAENGNILVALAGLTDIPLHGYHVANDHVVNADDIGAAIADLPPSLHFTSLDYRIAAACVLIGRCRERLED